MKQMRAVTAVQKDSGLLALNELVVYWSTEAFDLGGESKSLVQLCGCEYE